ncbi:HlyD family secretion protein [Haliea sp. E17]|uniref:HlyD family secretion protein n=1 Tax=Haliea sp. E17 TaxID=3401576 RepID=UPI003AAB860B
MLVGPLLLGLAALSYYLLTARYVSTENAYIHQDKISISAEVGGRIVEVGVRENQRVLEGDLLFRIDPEPYRLAVAEARAELAAARARVEELQTVYDTSSVQIDNAEEDIAYYAKEFKRQQELVTTRVSTEASLQAAEHDLAEARTKLASARAEASRALAALSTGGEEGGGNPDVRAAEVRLAQAELNLRRTEIRAPVNGIVSQTDRLQPGQLMVQSLPAVTIVKNDSSWVEANFKETDLSRMRVGQAATVKVDTYPGLELAAHVESIGAGTASEFAIIPAQNANANWVKVTQRIPVRIAIDDRPEQQLIAGQSVHVRVDIGE